MYVCVCVCVRAPASPVIQHTGAGVPALTQALALARVLETGTMFTGKPKPCGVPLASLRSPRACKISPHVTPAPCSQDPGPACHTLSTSLDQSLSLPHCPPIGNLLNCGRDREASSKALPKPSSVTIKHKNAKSALQGPRAQPIVAADCSSSCPMTPSESRAGPPRLRQAPFSRTCGDGPLVVHGSGGGRGAGRRGPGGPPWKETRGGGHPGPTSPGGGMDAAIPRARPRCFTTRPMATVAKSSKADWADAADAQGQRLRQR